MLYTRGMDIPLDNRSEKSRVQSRTRKTLFPILHGLVFGVAIKLVTDFLTDYRGPGWLKFGLILLPWLVLAATWRFVKKIFAEDELERIINRDALAFACYGLVAGIIVLEQFQAAGFMPRFKWENGHILLAMMLLMAGGIFWSGRRFR